MEIHGKIARVSDGTRVSEGLIVFKDSLFQYNMLYLKRAQPHEMSQGR